MVFEYFSIQYAYLYFSAFHVIHYFANEIFHNFLKEYT